MRKFSIIIIAVVLAISLSGCRDSKKNDSDVSVKDKLKVQTSIYPLEFIAGEIGKDKVEVINIVPVGVESHDFEPTGKEVAKMKEADLFILNGAGMEEWGEKLSANSDEKAILIASDHVDLIDLDEEMEEEHNHEEEHDHGDKDPHIWLSLRNMEKISEAVKERLIELDPENKNYYSDNCENLIKKFNELDDKYKEELKDRKSSTILVSHDAFGYLAKDYDMVQIPVTGMTPLAEPSPKAIASIIDLAKKENIKYIFIETLASPKSVQTIADEAGLKTETLNPIEGLTEKDIKNNENYLTLMEKNLESIKKELNN